VSNLLSLIKPHVIFVEYDMYLRLLYIQYLENPGWVTMMDSMRTFRLDVNQLVFPVAMEKHRSASYLI